VDRQRLQLLGVACMLVAAWELWSSICFCTKRHGQLFISLTLSVDVPYSKYEEICAPQVEEFCYITDNTYSRDEVWQSIYAFGSLALLAGCVWFILPMVCSGSWHGETGP
jgi:uncharacterized membrane protein YbhN (UPF0104 family)